VIGGTIQDLCGSFERFEMLMLWEEKGDQNGRINLGAFAMAFGKISMKVYIDMYT
jgi:hypothetical protein